MSVDAGLTPEVQQFIESMGLYFEQYDLPRIGGRLVGLLIVAARPLSLDEMASLLGVSRASVSTNIRMAVTFGMAEQVSLPGDRRDYYRFAQDAWERSLEVNIEGVRALRRIGERGLAAVAPDDTAAHCRLEELLEFCDVVLEDQLALLERWRARRGGA
jgi:predicted transcriptional regulator